jgi:CheY-like chemotaxis protein
VLDVMMPKINGYEVCHQLKSIPETSAIPVLMLTAKGQLEDKVRGFDKGADDYLPKPYDKAEFEARVKVLLKHTASTATNEQTVGDIRRLFSLCEDPTLSAYEKGLALEDLSAALFASCFDVYNRMRSETGEIDLWMERITSLPFWTDYGAIAIVECKNRSDDYPVTSAEISTLIDKCSDPGAKLGFFVSLGPFTRDALKKIRDQNIRRQGPNSPLIVPIRSKDIDELTEADCDVEEWLRQLVRSARQDCQGFYNYGFKKRGKSKQ